MPSNISEMPKWVSLVVSVLSVVCAVAVGYGSTQNKIENLSARDGEVMAIISKNEKAIELLDKEIELIKQEQIRDKMNLEYLRDSVQELSSTVRESNRAYNDFLTRFAKEIGDKK